MKAYGVHHHIAVATSAMRDARNSEEIGRKIFLDSPFEISEQTLVSEAKYKNRNVNLNKPFRTPGGPKKFAVYVKNKSGNVVKVTFGDPNLKIRSNNKKAAKSFRARHHCDNPGPKTKARYWSCRKW